MFTMKEVSDTAHIAEINSIKLENSSRATQLNKSVCMFPGFGWDAVNFFLTRWYGVVFWTCHENDIDSTGMF